MVNKNIFKSKRHKTPVADALTSHGTPAYAHEDYHALAQLACTGCFNDTFYTTAEMQVDELLKVASGVDSLFLAKTAVYSHKFGYMKDMPAVLLAILASRTRNEQGTKDEGKSAALFRTIFPQVITSGKMLRNFVKVMRSDVIYGRTFNLSANTVVKKCINNLLNSVSFEKLFNWSVGNDLPLGAVIRMTRPKPESEERAALFQYLLNNTYKEDGSLKTYYKGKVLYNHSYESLPDVVKQYENFKNLANHEETVLPKVDFRLLEGLGLSKRQWVETALNASWTETRMNLNKYQRHGVFEDKEVVKKLAQRLADPILIKKANVFPYQLLTTYINTSDIPFELREALQDAMEIAIANVPAFDTNVYVCIDHSASMRNPVTGYRHGSTTSVRCVDVAALMGAAVLRNNRHAQLLPFNTRVNDLGLNPRDTVVTNSQKITAKLGGGTACSAPLKQLNKSHAKGDLVIFVSDNESWFDARGWNSTQDNSIQQEEWQAYKRRNPKAKIVCIDITPNIHTQVKQRRDVLNIGGFSDAVFSVIKSFYDSKSEDHWLDVINSVNLS